MARKLTRAQIALVLDAIADLEGWDGRHDSVAATREGGWQFTEKGHPEPSAALRRAIARREGGE